MQPSNRYDNIHITGSARVVIGNIINHELPEDFTQKLEELQHVISNTEIICKNLHGVFATDTHIFNQLSSLAYEPQQIHRVLGTMKSFLEDEEFAHNFLWVSQFEDIHDLIEGCHTIMVEISGKIDEIKSKKPECNKDLATEGFTDKEVQDYRSKLVLYNVKFQQIINLATIHETRTTRENITQKVETLLLQLEEQRAANLPKAPPHEDIHRSTVPVDYGYPLNRYLGCEASIYYDDISRSYPSIQVSLGYGPIDTPSVRTYQSSNSGTIVAMDSIQIFITNLPISNVNTLLVKPGIDATVGDIFDSIRRRVGLEDAHFCLTYGNRVLDDLSKALRDYRIATLSTLRCVSFRPYHLAPGHWMSMSNPSTSTPDQSRLALQLTVGKEYSLRRIRGALLREYRDTEWISNLESTAIRVVLLSPETGSVPTDCTVKILPDGLIIDQIPLEEIGQGHNANIFTSTIEQRSIQNSSPPSSSKSNYRSYFSILDGEADADAFTGRTIDSSDTVKVIPKKEYFQIVYRCLCIKLKVNNM